MAKSKKKEKEPLVRCGGTMTESQYLAWIRSALRSKSLRWQPRNEALKLARRPYKGTNKLQKWEFQCAICKQWYKAKEVIVDHFPISAGSILSVDDIGPFANNLYCEIDNLRVLDKECHDIHTLSESLNITWEQAIIHKKVITAEKKWTVKEIVAFCQKHGYNDVSYNDVSNAAKRRTVLTEIYSKEKTDEM